MDLVFGTLLFLHIFGAIMAFGPTFTFAILGSMGGAEPQHGNFAIRASEAIAQRLVVPLALFVGLTGIGLIWRSGRNPLQETWLLIAIVLYVISLTFSFLVQTKTGHALVEATSTPPPPRPEGAPAPAGPPPHIAALVRRSQLGGMFLTVLLVLIVLLMVFKPTF